MKNDQRITISSVDVPSSFRPKHLLGCPELFQRDFCIRAPAPLQVTRVRRNRDSGKNANNHNHH
jgi:hypothetical protein